MSEKIWYAHRGAKHDEILKAEAQLSFDFPQDFKSLYEKSDGFEMENGFSYVHFWSLDSILSANEIFREVGQGNYVFFADADDGIDYFAYDRQGKEIYVFAGDEDMSSAEKCGENIGGLVSYAKSL
ncbi:MAG: SMI1/KNR4 family protein [Clostridia bacterium]|nr:SMI1/KNR4 family protein [Clostridia bacterium]